MSAYINNSVISHRWQERREKKASEGKKGEKTEVEKKLLLFWQPAVFYQSPKEPHTHFISSVFQRSIEIKTLFSLNPKITTQQSGATY